MKKTCPFIIFAIIVVLIGVRVTNANDKVTIATDATFIPFEYIDAEGNLVGYDIELMQAVCDAVMLDCDIANAAWDGMIPGLIDGKYDALISQLTVTSERRQIMAFSDIYNHPIFRFVAKKGLDLDISPEGLAGKVIAVQTGTPMDAYVSKYYPLAQIQRYVSGSAPYLDLTAGRADVHISYQAQIIHGFLNRADGADYELVGPQFTGADAQELGEGVAIAVNKNNIQLLNRINEGLGILRDNGMVEALNIKYFGQSSP